MSSPRKQVVKVKRHLATLPYALGKVQAGVRLVGAAISFSASKSQARSRSHPTGREPLLKNVVYQLTVSVLALSGSFGQRFIAVA